MHGIILMIKKKQVEQVRIEVEQGDELAKIRLEELYRMLDKIDVHEEIVRFKSHLSAFEATVQDESVDKGRRLDFTLQELMRETNTITAKCSSSAIGSIAVDIKVELEKAREQTQNIV